MFRQIECAYESASGTGAGGRLILGDGRCVPEEYLGKAQCVYLDPPFNTGDRYLVRGRAKGKDGKPLTAEAYVDRFESREAYHAFLKDLIRSAHALLNDSGTFFLHLDQRENAWGRLLCDEVFGEGNFVNEIIWSYQSGGRTVRRFSPKHDNILFYRKSRAMFFDITQAPISRKEYRKNHMKREVDETGRTFRSIRSGGKLYTYYDDEPVYPGDVWTDISHIQQKDPQRTGYDTQKPLALLERILDTASRPGDLVADLCCGSGTALYAAARGNRAFLGIDKSPAAVAVTRSRLSTCALEMDWPSGAEGAVLEAALIREEGRTRIRLKDYRSPADPDGEEGLNAIQHWAVGFVRDGRFITRAEARRLPGTGELREELRLSPGQTGESIQIIDLRGCRSVWIWTED